MSEIHKRMADAMAEVDSIGKNKRPGGVEMNLSLLDEMFVPDDIEWRIGRSGAKDGKPWATCLAYVTNRAIMERLDAACGKGSWKNKFTKGPDGGILCGISIRIGDEWVTKWDGAENTAFESVKGGLSGSMKRAAVQWGIGRYLYNLSEEFAIIKLDGSHYQPASKDTKKPVPAFRWDPPGLPMWAIPDDYEQKKARPQTNPASKQPETDPELKGIGEQMKDALAVMAEKASPEIVEGYKQDGVRLYKKGDKQALRELMKKIETWQPAKDSVEAAQRVFIDDIPEDIY